MENLGAIGWMMLGAVLGIVLMALMTISKDLDDDE